MGGHQYALLGLEVSHTPLDPAVKLHQLVVVGLRSVLKVIGVGGDQLGQRVGHAVRRVSPQTDIEPDVGIMQPGEGGRGDQLVGRQALAHRHRRHPAFAHAFHHLGHLPLEVETVIKDGFRRAHPTHITG